MFYGTVFKACREYFQKLLCTVHGGRLIIPYRMAKMGLLQKMHATTHASKLLMVNYTPLGELNRDTPTETLCRLRRSVPDLDERRGAESASASPVCGELLSFAMILR
jgi:hypothetical protein